MAEEWALAPRVAVRRRMYHHTVMNLVTRMRPALVSIPRVPVCTRHLRPLAVSLVALLHLLHLLCTIAQEGRAEAAEDGSGSK